MNSSITKPPRRVRGLTLIELLIAMAIAMMIAAAMAGLFAQSVKSRGQVSRDGQRIETGRYALDAMSDDIRLAGFYGDYLPRSTTGSPWPVVNTVGVAGVTWSVPDPCATDIEDLGWNNGYTFNSGAWEINSPAAINVPVAIVGYEGGHANDTLGFSCLPKLKAGTDVIVVRRLSTAPPSATAPTSAPTTVAVMTDNLPYFQATTCATQTPRFALNQKSEATQFTMHQLQCGTSVAPMRQFLVRIYHIDSCTDSGSGGDCTTVSTADDMPSMKVTELSLDSLGNRAMVTRVLAPGIEDMHFEYGVDTSGDGAPDGNAVSPVTPTLAPAYAWQNVVTVKAWVLARDLETTAGYTDSRSYQFGTQAIAAKGDAYKRNVFSSAIRVINPAGARELP